MLSLKSTSKCTSSKTVCFLIERWGWVNVSVALQICGCDSPRGGLRNVKNSVLKIVEVFFFEIIFNKYVICLSIRKALTWIQSVIPVQRIFLNFDISRHLELPSLTSCDSDFTRQESDSGEATLPGLLSALLGPTAALARAWRSTQAKS